MYFRCCSEGAISGAAFAEAALSLDGSGGLVMTPPITSEHLAALGATNLLSDGGGRRVNDAGVLPAATHERFPGPTEAPTLPTRCGIGFCAGAVLKNPLDTVLALDHAPPKIQSRDEAAIVVGRFAHTGTSVEQPVNKVHGFSTDWMRVFAYRSVISCRVSDLRRR
jgi:hypothetical protein